MLRFIGNVVWFIIFGLISSIAWFFLGLLWCITIIGIPIGKQCFKFMSLSAFPFGKEVRFTNSTVKTIINIIWIIFGGAEMALSYIAAGAVLCCTIIGIPLGLQSFKLAKLSLMPLGAQIIEKD